jgi:hypothetical protein
MQHAKARWNTPGKLISAIVKESTLGEELWASLSPTAAAHCKRRTHRITHASCFCINNRAIPAHHKCINNYRRISPMNGLESRASQIVIGIAIGAAQHHQRCVSRPALCCFSSVSIRVVTSLSFLGVFSGDCHYEI